MSGSQDMIFRWVSNESGVTGLLILAAGLIYGFYGFKLFRALLGLTCTGFGCLIGAAVANYLEIPPATGAAILGLGAGVFAIKCEHPASIVGCGLVWGTMGGYLAEMFTTNALWPVIGLLVCGGLGMLFAKLCYRTMTVILTTIQGSVLMVVGIVGLSEDVFPTFNHTFRAWAQSWPIVAPILMGAFFVMAYSFQQAAKQGDMKTGSS